MNKRQGIDELSPVQTNFGQQINFDSPQSNIENNITPNPKIIASNLSANQSTREYNTSPFYQSPNINWKTPVNLLKTNPFMDQAGFSTPNNAIKQQQDQLTPVSPYSDRYIPFRQEKVSRNLFQIQNSSDKIVPFEYGLQQQQQQQNTPSRNIYQSIQEEERLQQTKNYQNILRENILEIQQSNDDNVKLINSKAQSILQFKNTRLINDTENIKNIINSDKKQIAQQKARKIEQNPIKVLDAPGLLDDFYQDVLHWGKNNLIAVGLAQNVYLYNYNNGKVLGVAENLGNIQQYTSLQWNSSGQLLCMGNYVGGVQLWDSSSQRYISRRQQQLSSKRIGSISWANQNIFACGSKDKSIIICDIRIPNMIVNRFIGAHTQEVCSVQFSENENMLASGGNDNKVHIWSLCGGNNSEFLKDYNDQNNKHFLQWTIKDHKAAIRALSWNPHANGVLYSGGGSADKTIRTFSTSTNTPGIPIEVDSQVCKIIHSHNTNEFLSTHGYERNQIMVWQQNQKRICCLEGHQERVLYASLSPDESTLVSGSGDETLKFWNIFPKQIKTSKHDSLKLSDFR